MIERLSDMSRECRRWAVSVAGTRLPVWFKSTFAHVAPDEYQELVQVWSEEPVLRDMSAMLSALQPEHLVTIACPYCENRNITLLKPTQAFYHCDACDSNFSGRKTRRFIAFSVRAIHASMQRSRFAVGLMDTV
ncbi:hypothetical protein M3A49_36855 [Paraburkholderia sp. CNPSo 3076]|uniref:hypothetical protein n=1 Tax=Paraburkholderia sp. CNPSo 3076 TaxID=2940936 RepID=UPI002257429A|nr:hypothetical protein [Paraburkholderia sp. CNPSo 3076]MCX5544954.1 hypothetical protein [Paraburkholderia sp. CNPSo 3076]